MKVKKLLTLLLATSMIVACGTQTKPSSSANGSSESAPSSTSSDVPSTSSSSSNTSSPSSSSSAAPSTSASSSDPSSSSSAPVVVTLVSITVTAPTKLAYTTADTELDLTGMVVTANYSDATTREITEGYTVSPVDFSTAGDQTVTVTFEGKTDSFQITVAQAKPTAWDADLTAKFQANLYGYVPPFFYSPDFGLGTLTWGVNEQNKVVYAEGGNVAAQEAGQDSPLKPIGDLFIADGFVASKVPNLEQQDYFYVMEKAVTVEGAQRYLRVRIATSDEEGSFANGGQFYIDFCDPYFYDWAESGFEALVKQVMGYKEDIPDLPAGPRYLKDDARLIPLYAQYYGYTQFTVYDVDEDYAVACLELLAAANWIILESDDDNFDFFCVSPEGVIGLYVAFDGTKGQLLLKFDYAPEIPGYVNKVAAVFGIKGSGYAFQYDEEDKMYFYTFSETLGDGETLGDLVDKYVNTYLKNAEDGFTKKGDRTTGETYAYDIYVSSVIGATVYVYAGVTNSGATIVQILVQPYVDVPQQFIPAMTLLGADPSKAHTENGQTLYHAYFDSSVTLQDGIKHFTDILDADTTLNFKVVTPVTEGTLSGSGAQCFYCIYANNNVSIEFLAYVADDGRTDVQMRFTDYTPAPESPWVDAFAEGLGISFTWDSEEKEFVYGAKIQFNEGDTFDAIANGIASQLLAVDDTLELLTSQRGSTYTVLTYFGDYGCIEIQAFTNDGKDYRIRIGIKLFADPEADPYLNAISALLGSELVESTTQPGVYLGAGTNVNDGLNFKTTNYGKLVATGYSVGKNLINSSLGFSFVENESGYDTTENVYVAKFTNADGWVVYLYFVCNNTGVFSGKVQYIVVAPAD